MIKILCEKNTDCRIFGPYFSTGHQIAVDPKITSLPEGLMGVDVTGSTMGIIGMGHIGNKIAQRGKGFDMKILYHNRSRR